MFPSFSDDHPPRVRTMLVIAALLLNAVGVLSLEASLTDNARLRRERRAQDRGIDAMQIERMQMAPVRLRIAGINVDAPVVPVGMREDGLMDIPSTAHETGWFSLGYLPGSPGNAVLAGHLDKESGQPAVFWNLRRLKPGDIVELERGDGVVLRYRVIGSKTYPMDNAPLDEIFGSATGSRLNLVTCNGAWQEHLATYNRRLVVYTEYVESRL